MSSSDKHEKAKSLFITGLIIFNIYLVPIAAIAIYTAYKGKTSNDNLLLVAGIVLAILAPLLAYLLAMISMRLLKILPQEEEGAY
jgi:threonine/homoserine efflux transporter RhtA